MKKIDFKFSKRQAILFVALIALTSFGVWSANTLSSSAPQPSVDSLKRVTEHVSDVPPSVEPEIIDNTVVNVAPTTQEVVPEPEPAEAPAPTVYEKYGVSESIVQKFESYYPTYASHNKDLFVSDVSKVVSAVGEDNAIRVIETHANKTGVNGTTIAEKNSFMRLHLTYGISFEPWSTVL